MDWALLLKVSGGVTLGKTSGNRCPKYAEYIIQTNAFFPGPRQAVNTFQEARK